MILNSPYISGSLTVTGNTNLMGALTLTGSLFGTSSQATSASYAQTSSFANAFTVGGTLTAQTLVVQTVTSSIVYSSGSNIFGNSTANTQTMTGSVNITGSLNVVGNVTSNGGFTATGSYNLLQSNGGNLFINSSGQLGNTGTGVHITMAPASNRTTLTQIVTTDNGLNVTPGANSLTYALSITSGSYPAAVLLTVGSNILTVTGSTVGINKAAPKAALDVSGSVLITGSLSVTGGITGSFSGSITGSLFGTASQALTASFVNPLRQTVILSGSLTVSASATALSIQGSGSSVFTIDGTVGRLFQVDDSLSGSLFSVNTTSGLPVVEAFSDNTVRIGQYGQKGLFVSQSRVGVGTETPVTNLDVSGSVRVTNGLSETGSVNISGSVTMTGSFTTSGTITAQTLVVQTVTSSIVYSSGSNIFGNALTNTQTFTGSVNITGSITQTGVNTTSSFSGNVGIGITTPSAVLHTSGVTKLGGGNLHVSSDQTFVTSNSYTFRDAMGINNPNSVSYPVSSNYTVAIGSSGGGGSLLTAGPIYSSGSITVSVINYPQLVLNSSNNNGPQLRFQGGGSDTSGIGHISSVSNLQFSSTSSLAVQMTLSQAGNVSIGSNLQFDSNGDFYQKTTGGAAIWAPTANTTYPSYGFYGNTGIGMYRASADVLAFTTSASERMRITSAGYVGIGTTAPASKLHVAGAGNAAGGNIIMGQINDSTAKWSYLVSTQYNSSTQPQGFTLIGGYSAATENSVIIGGSIYEANPATSIQFWTHTAVSHSLGGSQRMTITSAGVVDLLYGQLKFPATQNPSSDANTLDDYEEGTWTPANTNTSTATGVYTKIGRLVTVQAKVIWNGVGAISLSGLPFTTSATVYAGSIIYSNLDVPANTIGVVVVNDISSTYITAYTLYDNASAVANPVTKNGTEVYITLQYNV